MYTSIPLETDGRRPDSEHTTPYYGRIMSINQPNYDHKYQLGSKGGPKDMSVTVREVTLAVICQAIYNVIMACYFVQSRKRANKRPCKHSVIIASVCTAINRVISS